MKKINLFIIAALITTFSWGQNFTENFDYPLNQTLAGTNSWVTINTTGSNPNPYTINGTGLSYPGSPSSGVGFGTSLATNVANGQYIGRFLTAITTGSVYMSFFVNVSSASAAGANYAAIMNGPSPSPGGAARSFIRTSGGGFQFGIGKTALTPVTYESTVRTFNTTYLVVLKYSFNAAATDDIVDMWINPALGVIEPAAQLSMGAGLTDGTSLTGPAFYQRTTTTPTCQIDGVRFGTTWAYVTPPIVPTLAVSAATLNLGTTILGVPTPSLSFNLSGTFLSPAPGTITVTSPSADFQVSNDNATWGSSTTITNATATLAATPVYVRFLTATAGAASAILTFSGGSVVAPPTVTVSAAGGTPFYSKSTGTLIDVNNWGSSTNGTGTAPPNFVNDYQIFTIANRANYTLDADFQVLGLGSKIVVGDGTNPTKLILPAVFTITSNVDNKVDVSNLSTVEVANKIMRGGLGTIPFPYFGNMANSSTVEYTWNGTTTADTVRIPFETFGNLKLTNGLKYFSSGFAFVNGNLDITDVVGMNGTGSGASILVRGNVTLSNSFFDTDAFADANRVSLNLGGTATQTLSGGDFYLNQLRTQAVSGTVPASTIDIVLAPNTNIFAGIATGGGFNLQQASHNLSLNGNSLYIQNGGSFLSTNQGTISGSSNSNLFIVKSAGAAAVGSISFRAGGQVLNNFTYSSAGAGTNNLNLNSPLTVNGALSFVAGNILLGSNTLTAAGTITGASATSYVVTNGTGSLKINGVGASNVVFPVGPTTALYHPATINNSGTSDNFSVNVAAVAPSCRDAASSVTARWNITEQTVGGSNCTISLNYTGAATGGSYSAVIAKIVDCGGSGPSYYGSGSVTGTVATGSGFTSFSPFGITSDLLLLPVTFINFSGIRIDKRNKLTWITGNEQNNLGFEILRSKDGQNFSSIGFVNTQAPGGSTSSLTYDFFDNNINSSAVLYYKLRQVDMNSQSSFSGIVTIKGAQSAILTIDGIAPNPVQNNLIASISSPTKNLVNLQVLDMMGRIIMQQQKITIQEGTNVIPVNVSMLGSGIYLLRIVFPDNKQIPAIKFIKQ